MQGEWEIVGFEDSQPQPQSNFADQWANAVMRQESAFNPRAVSSAGAQGLMQIMPATGREVAQKLGMQNFDPFNPEQNQIVGKAYLNQMYEQFGSPELALAAYNAGPGNVQKAIARAGTNDPSAVLQFLPRETQDYVPKVQRNFQGNYGKPNVAQGDWEIVPDYEIVQEQPAYQPRPAYIPKPEKEVPPPQEMGWGDYANKLVAQGLNSAGFNLLDNYANQYQKLPDLAKQAVSNFPMFGPMYKAILGNEEMKTENLKEFQKENPKASFVANLAGAIAQPAALTSTLPRATGSAVAYGLGDRVDETTDPKELGKGALVDALIGSGGYGVAKTVGKGVEAYKGWKGSGNLTKAEKLLAEKLKEIPEDSLVKAKATLEKTTQPMFLPEALQIEDFTNQANRVANAPETSGIVQAILNERKKGQAGRYNEILDALSPERDTFNAGNAIQKRAQAVIDAEEKAREEAAQEFFGKAYKRPPVNDVIQDPKFNEVMSSEVVQPIINRLKKFPKYQNLRDDHPKVVQKVLEEITAEMDGPNVGSLANDLGDLKTTIYSTLETANPDLIKARDIYRINSEKIEALKDLGLGSFADKGQFNVTKFGSELLNPDTPIQKIKAVSKALGDDGDELILSAVRAELSKKIDQRVGGNGTSAIFNKEFIKDRLTKIIGEDRADTIIKRIDDEILISDQSLNYKMSPVRNRNQGNEAADFVDKGRDFFAYYGRYPMRAIGDGLSATLGRFVKPSTQTLQEEAKTIFSNQNARDALVNILAERNYKPSSASEQALINALLTRGAQKAIPTMEIKNSYKNN